MEETPKTQDQILKEALDQYGEIKYQIDGLKSSKQTAIDKILQKYPEARAEIDELEDELGIQLEKAEKTEKQFRKKLDFIIEQYGKVAPIKDVLEFKSNTMRLKYTKKITYDPNAMDGLALENPKILAFRKEEMSTRLDVIKK